MSKGTISKDFTKGPIAKQMFLFMLPFMLSNAMQVLYNTVDMIIVGHFVDKGVTSAGIAAVGQSSQIVNFATMVTLGFSNAGQVLLAQALGDYIVWQRIYSRLNEHTPRVAGNVKGLSYHLCCGTCFYRRIQYGVGGTTRHG